MINLSSLRTAKEERAVQQKALDFNWFDVRNSEKIMEYADIIFERVTDRVDAFNPMNMLFDTQQGELGKRIRFKEVYGGRVYTRTYGEYKPASPIKASYYTITTTPKTLHLFYPVEDIKAGVILTSQMVDMANKAILHHRIKLMWDTLKTAIGTSSDYVVNAGTTMSQAGLLSAINGLADVAPVQAVIGRRSYLSSVVAFSGYDNTTGYPDGVKTEIHNTGWIGKFAGVSVLGLESFEDDLTGTAAIDNTNAFVIGAKTKNWNRWVEVTPLAQSVETRVSDGTFHVYYDFEDGFAVWKPKYMRRIWNGV